VSAEFIGYIDRDVMPLHRIPELKKMGFLADDGSWANYIQGHVKIGFRPELEVDETKKQIIPYCVVMDEAGNVFATERLSKSGEERLRGKVSIGIGGHMDIADRLSIHHCLTREIYEEIGYGKYSALAFDYKGIVNNDTDEVGRVHLGLVYLLCVSPRDREKIAVQEVEKLRGFWIEGSMDQHEYEGWSQILLPHIEQWRQVRRRSG
jgi:predicted NUDIX family phosphoesterase